MNTADAIAHVLKREGVEMLFAYPANPLKKRARKLTCAP